MVVGLLHKLGLK